MELYEYIVFENTSIIDVMKKINNNTRGIACVCDGQKLKAIVTDGDIRRYILKRGDLNNSISEIANYNPLFIKEDSYIDYKKLMRMHSITAIPIVDDDMNVLRVEFLIKQKERTKKDLGIPVVIMAGGKGSRLYPYTNILPKPLIPIGEKTIIEHIMDKFEIFGCKEFNVIINYKKNLIKSFFIDNEHDYKIEFTEESEYYGTGGGLKLLKGRYLSTFFVSNCDIIIDEDYANIVATHKKNNNLITIVSALKNITIPYGTIEATEECKVINLIEKPKLSFITNTGLYVMEPNVFEKIPDQTHIHITEIIQRCIEDNENVGIYLVNENSWMDMGQIEELEKMKQRMNDKLE